MERVNSITAQISSLNDELRDTLSAVELAHSKRDGLLSEIAELEKQKESYLNFKREVKQLEIRERELLASIENKEQDIVALNTELDGLESVKRDLVADKNKALLDYETQKKTLKSLERKVKSKNEELVATDTKLESSKNSLAKSNKVFLEVKEEAQQAKNAIILSLEQLEEDKIKHYQRVVEFETKKSNEERELKKSKEKFARFTGRDIRVVVKRLEREWKKLKPSVPFPKIKWVQ